MTEMYWITRFDGISGFLTLIAVLSVTTTIVVFLNDTAKQLPDKCIKALDKWVENLNEKEKTILWKMYQQHGWSTTRKSLN